MQQLWVDLEHVRVLRHQTRYPRPGTEHEFPCMERVVAGHHRHSVAVGMPALHLCAESQLGPGAPSHRELGPHGGLGMEDAGLGFEVGLGADRRGEHREPLGERPVGEVLVRDLVPDGVGARLDEERVVRVADHEPADLPHQRHPGLGLELAPEHVGAANQRCVLGSLADRQPGDPRVPVRRTAIVRRVVTVQPDHARPAPREPAEHRAAHCAEPDHDRVGVSGSRVGHGLIVARAGKSFGARCISGKGGCSVLS